MTALPPLPPTPPPRRGGAGPVIAVVAALGVVGLVVVAVLAVLLAATVWSLSTGGEAADDAAVRYGPHGVVALPGEGSPTGEPTEVIAGVSTIDGEGLRTELVRVDTAGAVRWRQPIDGGTSWTIVGLAGDLVLVQTSATLQAHRVDDGSPAWPEPAHAVADRTCGGCLHEVGSALVATTLLHEVTALDRATGEELWRHAPRRAPVGPVVAGPTVVVGEQVEDDTVVELVALDAETGAERQRLRPSCAAGGVGDAGADPVLDLALHPVPGSADVVVVSGTSPCVLRWSTASGEVAWTSEVEAVSILWAAVGTGTIALASEEGPVLVDLDDGTTTTRTAATSSEEAVHVPLGFADGVLVTAERIEGGSTGPVHGWAPEGDDPPWSLHALDASARTATPPAPPLGHGGGRSAVDVVAVGEAGISVLAFPREATSGPDDLHVSAIDPATGDRAVRAVDLGTDDDPHPLGTRLHGLAGGWALVLGAGRPQLVDLASGTVVATWPVPAPA